MKHLFLGGIKHTFTPFYYPDLITMISKLRNCLIYGEIIAFLIRIISIYSSYSNAVTFKILLVNVPITTH